MRVFLYNFEMPGSKLMKSKLTSKHVAPSLHYFSLFQCILSAVIVVALKGVLIQIGDFPEYFRKSKLDGLLWFGTFLGVILTTVDTGKLGQI